MLQITQTGIWFCVNVRHLHTGHFGAKTVTWRLILRQQPQNSQNGEKWRKTRFPTEKKNEPISKARWGFPRIIWAVSLRSPVLRGEVRVRCAFGQM